MLSCPVPSPWWELVAEVRGLASYRVVLVGGGSSGGGSSGGLRCGSLGGSPSKEDMLERKVAASSRVTKQWARKGR